MPTERDVWAQSYEGDLHRPLKTQNEIAGTIAGQFRAILDRQDETALKKQTEEHPVAYEDDLK
jgi:hypothetical protein